MMHPDGRINRHPQSNKYQRLIRLHICDATPFARGLLDDLYILRELNCDFQTFMEKDTLSSLQFFLPLIHVVKTL